MLGETCRGDIEGDGDGNTDVKGGGDHVHEGDKTSGDGIYRDAGDYRDRGETTRGGWRHTHAHTHT